MAEERTEILVGREVFRLLKAARETPADKLLDEVLGGRERTIENITKLWSFVSKHFGLGPSLHPNRPELGSDTAAKIWTVCRTSLEEAGLGAKQIEKIRNPLPVKRFRSILDEMCEEGHDV